MITVQALASLAIGVLIGYLGQKSGACFIGGYRDLVIIRNAYLFKAVLGVLVGSFTGYVAFKVAGSAALASFPLFLTAPGMGLAGAWFMTVIGGLGLGFFSVFAGGCPFRLHVQAGEGSLRAMFYVLGFYAGILYFYAYVADLVELLARVIG